MKDVDLSLKDVEFSLDDMDIPERSQEHDGFIGMVPEVIYIVIGFGIFEIGVDSRKFSRLES